MTDAGRPGEGAVPEASTPVPDVVQQMTRDLLGGPADLDRRAVSREVGLSMRTAERFWHVLGVPQAGADTSTFTQSDLEALDRVAGVVRRGVLDEETALALVRAVGRTSERLATWQRSVLAEAFSPWHQGAVHLSTADLAEGHDSTRAEPDAATAHLVAERIGEIADELEPLLVHAWRRHLVGSVARMVADADPEGGAAGGLQRAVGFADLVSFTSLVRRLSQRELAVVVERFETVAADVVTDLGGRVVKTVGDEVLFVAGRATAGARIALELQRVIETDPVLPAARIGVAYGPIVSRMGDVYGTTVNKAARLTAVAPSGRILVDEALAARVAGEPGLATVVQRARTLRGVGVVVPSLLQRAIPSGAAAAAPPAPENVDTPTCPAHRPQEAPDDA